jgi:hypothetical protein
MKQILLVSYFLVAGLCSFSQNIEKAKGQLSDKKLSQAKSTIDKILTNEKNGERNAKDPDVWYTKAKIYAAIADDSLLKSTVPDAREQAFAAIKKYEELDAKENKNEKSRLVMLQLEQYKPVMDIYQGYYRTGASYYNSNNFVDAFASFKKCLEVSDYMIQRKWSNLTLDTSVILYAGIAAEKTNNRDSAAYYYSQLADKKIVGDGMIEIYKWLADYYNQKGDIENTKKYLLYGMELYPKDNFWTSMELEIAGRNGDKETLYKKYDEMMGKEPDNYIYPYNYGVELYREAYLMDSSTQKRPANSEEMIARAGELIKKSIKLNPEYYQANLVMGQIYYNQAVDLSARQRNIKPGLPNSKLTPEEIKTKEDLRNQMMDKFSAAIPYLEEVEKALGNQGKLKQDDKRTLKDAYDLLITIHDNKENKDKMKEYEDKFNNVDKKH